MAWQLILRLGDTTTYDVTLTSGVCFVTDYALTSPAVDQQAIANMGDGQNLTIPTFTNVSESVSLHIQDATPTLVRDIVRRIERLLDIARQGSLGAVGDKVYLVIRFDQDTEWWRSQVLAAQWVGNETVERIHKNYTTGTIALTRRYYWETEALIPVAVSSGVTTTPTTGYATVYNADDTHASNRNWFQADAAQVVGSLPAPALIRIKNTSGADRAATSIFLGNYVFCDPVNVDPIYRAEDASSAFTNVTTTEADIYKWSLSSSGLVDDFRGQYGRFVAVWTNLPNNTTLVRPAIRYSTIFDLALGEQQLGDSYKIVQDLGALPIPPSGWSAGMGANMQMAISGKAATGTDTVTLDWLQIFPSGQGRYRALHAPTTLSLINTNEIVDDGPNGVVYILDIVGGNAKAPLYRPMFDPIHLWPGQINRMRLLISGGISMEAGQVWGVKVEYRARRLTL
jgi:hypothetical protein